MGEGPLPARRVVLDDGFDRPGGDLQQLFNTTREACVAVCLADAQCSALTYNVGSRACFPKGDAAGPLTPFPGAQSGTVIDTDPTVIAAATARAAAAKDWLSAADLKAAREQANDIGATWPGTGEGAPALRQLAQEASGTGGEAVIRWIGAATAISDEPGDWLSLSQWLTTGDDGESRSDAAMSAAINSWLRDPGAGSLALRRWAELAEKQNRGRDGLKALRLAATTDTSPELAQMLAGFEERNGFRMEDTQVDADAAAPRACLRMSDALAPGTDYRSFVVLPDQTLAVEAEDRQLCIAGITHGQRLQLTLRKGLPAADGEVLARDVPVNLYVRDRTPQARFTGRAYVLPAGGDQGVTVRTVNTDRVALTLYRMSDRNIVRALRQDIFGQPLDDWRAESFTDELGQQVWTGEADVAPGEGGGPAVVNTEVATRLDIARAAGPLAPGVYALTAAVPGQDADRSPPATQWFMISNLGLASYGGTDGLTVAVRGLDDAAAREGVTVQLVSRANAVLGSAQTDADGIARFAAGLSRGRDSAAPAMVTASIGTDGAITDMAFLSLTEPEFDLSDRGVEGAPPAPPIDVFATTDRGAYRAGETVHATILARDSSVAALSDLPMTAILTRPDGVEAQRQLVPFAGDGGYVFDWPIPASAPRGSWRIDLKVDTQSDAPPLATLRVLVEDFRPERIDLTPVLTAAPLPTDRPLDVALTARWLYGAPGAELPVEGELRLAPATEVTGWAGYAFGRYDAPDDSTTVQIDPGMTDAEGHWQSELPVPPALAEARRPMEATFALSVREGAGRPVERRETRLVMPQTPVLGIKPGFDGSVPEGSEAAFQLVSLGPELTPLAGTVGWVLNRVDTEYQWYALEGDWQWEPVTTRSRAASGQVQLAAGAPTQLAMPVQWGEYELVVTAADGAQTAVRFWAGWGAADTGTDTPDRMTVTLDKPAYRAGDTARLTMDAAADGVAVVSVLSNRVVAMQTVPVKAGPNNLDLPVTDDWGAGVYVAVSAIRPLDATAATSHAPVRTLGLAHAAVDPGARRLQAELTAPPEVRPRGETRLRLAVRGAAPGETVHATVAAVDEGILNLTGFKAPDPLDHYFGQRRLGVALRDLYGRLLLASGVADGAIRSGGDAASGRLDAPPPTEKLMAWFSGPVTLGPDGTAEVAVPLPDFNGSVKAMAVVWTRSAVGQADTTLLVRDPVVMTVTAPAFLAPGDTAEVQLALAHVSGPAGAVGLTAEVAGGPALGLANLAPEVPLADKGRGEAGLTLTAPQDEGVAQLRLSARLPNGEVLTKDLSIPVESQEAAITRSARITLAPGETAMLDPAALGAFRPGTGTATLSAGAWAQLDVGAAALRLATYPYGCTEQIASAAMPQLYMQGLLPGITLPGSNEAPRNIDQAIAAVLTRQTSSGAFGLWQAEPGDAWLDAYTTDFLSRARTTGHQVPDEAFRRALANLQNTLNAASEPQYADPSENAALAYAAYVLARERAAVVSDLRYYVDTAGDSFATPMAAAQLGAALAAYGDVGRADAMFRRAQAMLMRGGADKGDMRGDYGTALRDAAAALTMATEAGSEALDRTATATAVAGLIAGRQAEGADLSTQEALWVVLAGHALQAAGAPGLAIGDSPAGGALTPLGDAAGLAPLRLTNSGATPLPVTLSATATPTEPPAAGGTAWSITRNYFTPEGAPVDPAQVAQGTRLVAVLTVTPLAEGGGRLIIADPLPAGFEIDNPNLISSGEGGGLSWLDDLTEAEMAEFRQDRFAAAVNWSDSAPFNLAYRLRAVSLGDFRHPAATVEDMYRPERRGWTDSGQTRITR
ncbi:alpha-2-macroglobulin family protein [Paracoccus suum]|nr:alpha-2-macroglobulin family protein [Paracoccus suum]